MKNASKSGSGPLFALNLATLILATIVLAQTASAKVGDKSTDLNLEGLDAKACVIATTACNSTVTGELTADDCELDDSTKIDFWEFQGNSGQTVTIDLTSGDFDTFLFLLDPNSDTETFDDDGGSGTNSRIVHTLDATGTWTIGANAFFLGDLGSYSLTLSCSADGPNPPAAPSNLTATTISAHEIELGWQDNSNNEDEFRIEIRDDGAAPSSGFSGRLKRTDLLAKNARPLDTVELAILPEVDHQALLAEDAARSGPGVPLRFAQRQEVFLSPRFDGRWETLPDGDQLWRLRVRSPGALSLSFAFTRYSMPAGGRLLVYSPDGETLLGPYGAKYNRPRGQLWTPIVPGDEAVIEARVPDGNSGDIVLELTAVHHAYRDLRDPTGAEKSGACNIDVVCPEAAGWEDQVRSVARIIVGGTSLCTGAMINNTAGDLKPLFLTADHCGLTPANAASLITYWNFDNSTCRPPSTSGGSGDGSLSQSLTGSTYLAGSPTSDFTLVQLDQTPPGSFGVFWAGWDRRTIDFPAATAIHHPQGDEKRISFEYDPTSTTSYLGNTSPGDGSHIRVEDWDLGTTESGSSGSPLFNDGQLVVGQLHGGYAACGNDLSDWYGRLSTSWNLGLSSWLDPGNTGVEFIDGQDSAGSGGFVDLGSVSADVIETIVIGLDPATTYTFRVRARNADGDSDYSNEASATTLPDGGIFTDGFESGDTTRWSTSVP